MSRPIPTPSFTSVRAALVVASLLLTGCASGGIDTSGTTIGPGGGAGGTASTNLAQAGNAQGLGTTTAPPTIAQSTAPAYTATTATPAGTAPVTTRNLSNPIQIPEASACSPGPGALPDGLYFGFLGAALDDVFEFDLACWYTGEPAAQAAAEDGQESPPPNDYYIRNSVETTRTEPVSPNGLTVYWLANLGTATTAPISYNEWISQRDPDYDYVPPLWITIQNGVVVEIVEQYLP